MRPVVLVIPNWNGEGHLRRLFPTIASQTLAPARVLVVDNGSADGSVAFARSQGAEVLQLERNLGFAAAVNRGIAATTEPLVGILNNDVTLDARYFEELAGAVGSGALRRPDGTGAGPGGGLPHEGSQHRTQGGRRTLAPGRRAPGV